MSRSPGPILILASLLLAAAPGSAHATSSVTVSGSSDATHLALDGEGSSSTRIVRVAVVALDTDGPGFTVSIGSGSLSKADGQTPIPFQVALVDEGAAPPAPAAFTVASGARTQFTTTVPGAVRKDLYIMYCSESLQDPGTYSASIDVDITDN